MPNFGNAPKRTDSVPAFLLGDRRWRLIAALAHSNPGKTAAELVEECGAGQAWVYEVLRALRPLGAVERGDGYRYRLNQKDALGGALIELSRALEPLANQAVERPRRSR